MNYYDPLSVETSVLLVESFYYPVIVAFIVTKLALP